MIAAVVLFSEVPAGLPVRAGLVKNAGIGAKAHGKHVKKNQRADKAEKKHEFHKFTPVRDVPHHTVVTWGEHRVRHDPGASHLYFPYVIKLSRYSQYTIRDSVCRLPAPLPDLSPVSRV